MSPHIAPAAHVADCGALLQSAGFTLPTVDVDTITVSQTGRQIDRQAGSRAEDPAPRGERAGKQAGRQARRNEG